MHCPSLCYLQHLNIFFCIVFSCICCACFEPNLSLSCPHSYSVHFPPVFFHPLLLVLLCSSTSLQCLFFLFVFRLWLKGKVPRLQLAAAPRTVLMYPYKVHTNTHTLMFLPLQRTLHMSMTVPVHSP